MKYATSAQVLQFGKLVVDLKVSEERAKVILESGLFTDLLKADLVDRYDRNKMIDRNSFRRLLGEEPIASVINLAHPTNTEELLVHVRRDPLLIDLFPYRSRTTAAMESTGFDRYVTLEEAVAWAEGYGLQPPVYEDALAIAYLFPRWVEEDTIFPHEPVGEKRRLIAFIEGKVVVYSPMNFSRYHRFFFVQHRIG